MSDTPRTDAVLAASRLYPGSSMPDRVLALCATLERELAQAIADRDEARYHADSDVCCSIDCGTSLLGKDGWRKDSEADEYELRYAAKRGFIERHPERPTWLKFTKAGKALIAR